MAAERGSTYVFVGTPDERRRVEILRGSLLSRMVRELPGIDIRVIADRALREERRCVSLWRRKPVPRAAKASLVSSSPFADGALDPAVLQAAIRIARAEEAILVPAFLVVVPLEYDVEAALARQAEERCPCSRRSRPPPRAPVSPSTLASSVGGRRSTPSAVSGRWRRSTASSCPRLRRATRLLGQGRGLDARARAD